MSEFPAGPPLEPWNDESEDWPKRTWDFQRVDDTPINNLNELSAATGWAIPELARMLLNEQFGRAAPQELIEEARRYGDATSQ